MNPESKRKAKLLAEAREYAATAKFYFVISVILTTCAVIFYKVYLPCGRVWDQEVLQESIWQGGSAVKGTYASEAMFLTILCAVSGMGSLFWAGISYGRMRATLHKL